VLTKIKCQSADPPRKKQPYTIGELFLLSAVRHEYNRINSYIASDRHPFTIKTPVPT